MIDVAALRGSTVRDNAGTRGEILHVSLPWVRVGWWDEGAKVPRVESFLRSDPRVAGIEILTINEGWVPASRLVGAGDSEELETSDEPEVTLSEDLQALILEKARSPFKRAGKIGRSVRNGKWKEKKDYWDCNGSNYKYTCTGKEGEVKKITRDPGKKAEYNKDYKEYMAMKQKTAASFTKITMKNRKAKAKAKKK